MSKANFNVMTLNEAKRYFLKHCDDQEALYAYMDKLHASGRAILIDPTAPDSEAKAIAQFRNACSKPTINHSLESDRPSCIILNRGT